jgi:hypothetical protein
VREVLVGHDHFVPESGSYFFFISRVKTLFRIFPEQHHPTDAGPSPAERRSIERQR